jgi:hypothetical protein
LGLLDGHCRAAHEIRRPKGDLAVHDWQCRVQIRGDANIDDSDIGVSESSEHVDRRATEGEIPHHLRGHAGRVRRDAFSCHAVVGGQYEHGTPLQPRPRASGDPDDLAGQSLESTEAAEWLGQAVQAPPRIRL